MTGCLNGGSCFFDNENETFRCSCKFPWTGERCDLGKLTSNFAKCYFYQKKKNFGQSSNVFKEKFIVIREK